MRVNRGFKFSWVTPKILFKFGRFSQNIVPPSTTTLYKEVVGFADCDSLSAADNSLSLRQVSFTRALTVIFGNNL